MIPAGWTYYMHMLSWLIGGGILIAVLLRGAASRPRRKEDQWPR